MQGTSVKIGKLHMDELLINYLDLTTRRTLVYLRCIGALRRGLVPTVGRADFDVVFASRVNVLLLLNGSICHEEGFGFPLSEGW